MNMIDFLAEIGTFASQLSTDAQNFLNELKEKNNKQSVVTATGKKILLAMKENEKTYSNMFSAKQLGEILFMPPRSVSGSMRKLVSEGYVEKKGTSPSIIYGLTPEGVALADGLTLDSE